MLNISSNKASFLIITLGTLLINLCSLPLNAQTRINQSNPESWKLEEKTDWNFSSENESISISDDLEGLEEYSISEPNTETDLAIMEEERKWGNRGDVEDYSIELEVYDY